MFESYLSFFLPSFFPSTDEYDALMIQSPSILFPSRLWGAPQIQTTNPSNENFSIQSQKEPFCSSTAEKDPCQDCKKFSFSWRLHAYVVKLNYNVLFCSILKLHKTHYAVLTTWTTPHWNSCLLKTCQFWNAVGKNNNFKSIYKEINL